MGSVTACFARVAKTLSPEDREAILKPIRDEITGRISAASKADPNADANAVALKVLDGMLSDAGAQRASAPQPKQEAAPATGRGASQAETYKDAKGRPIKAGDNVRYSSGGVVRHATIGKFAPNAEGAIVAYDTDGKVIGQPYRTEIEVIEPKAAAPSQPKPEAAPPSELKAGASGTARLVHSGREYEVPVTIAEVERYAGTAWVTVGEPPARTNWQRGMRMRVPLERLTISPAASQPPEAAPAPAAAPSLPAPAPSAAALTDADLAADKELQDALGHLGDVLGDVFGAKKNITGPQFGASDLLPALSRVVELLVRKGLRSFKAAVTKAAQVMRANAATAPHVDAITPRQWKAAYNAIAEGHAGTDTEEAVAAITADEVKALVAAPERAQNDAREPNQPPVGAADSIRGEAPGRGRGAPAQQRPAQVDPVDVGAREPGDVATPPAAPAGRAAGEGAASPDVGAQEGSDGGGPAGDGRPRAGGTRDADARAGSRGRKPAAGRGKPAPVDPESVSPANPGPGDFVIDDPLRIVGGGQVARFEKNKAAIELRNRLVEEGRAPTREEQEVLAGYTGWGSFGQELFQGNWERPAPKAGWEERDRWLRDNLGRKEWEGMQTSIINAHYTDPPTVMAMWDMVRRMGFSGGRVLEPSIGIGNFYGMMPADLTSRSQRAGIELDPVTGSMAQMLYPRANIQIKGYEQSTTPDNFYDLVIGNWPFFEQGPADRRYNRLSPTLHDYFFLKAIDQAKPGGLVVGITTHGTMDKKGIGARMEMARKAELVAAFRLPTGAFQEYAGTKVVTDIIILRKRAQPTDLVAKDGWIDVLEHNTAEGTKVWVNEYFHRHPEHVIGRIDFGHGTTTFRPGLIVHRPDNMMAELRRIVDMVPEGAFKADQTGKRISYVANHTSDRTNALVKTDKGLFVVQGEYLAPANEVLKYELKSPAKTAERVRELESLIDMRRLYGRLIDAERAGNAEKERTALREAYEAFVKRSGALADSFGLSYLERIDDPFYPSLAALEVNGKPAAILSRSTMRGARSIDNPSISDAFVLARAEAINPTLERIAAIAKKPQAAVKAALIESGAAYELPNGDFAAADIYLSGNVREKLRAAKAALDSGNAAMKRNVDALTEVQPPTIPYYKIETQMGATWVPAAAYEEYIAHMLGMDKPEGISVKFEAGSWKVDMDGALNQRPQASSGAGVPHVKFKRLVRAAISNQTITVKRRDSNGDEYVDDTATKETNAAISDMRTKFGEWLWSDPTRRVQLEAEYNEVRNAYATPRFDGSFLGFQGMALSLGRGPFNLRQHQANAIWRALVTRKSLNAHEVGTGKTFTMGGIAVESRRYGIAKKPLILAHNANSKSVAHEIQQMYPAARVLYVDNLSKENVKTRMMQIANDDWDAVVIPHSLIGRIGFKEETLKGMAKEEIDDLEQAAIEAANEDNVQITKEMWEDEEELAKLRSATAKQLVKQRLKIITTIQKLAQQASKEDSVAFEDLGVDMVMVDEAHEFKKPPIATKMKMKGLQTATSDRSIALMFMTKYIRAMNGGANVHLFTGTPITNTMTEVFHMMRYMMQEEMKDAALADWDGWFGSFAREVTDVELNPAGEYEAVTRLQSFINVPELRRMIGQYMDVVFAEDMPEMQLRLVDGKRLTDKDLTDEQRRAILQGRTENALDRPYKKVINENSDMTPEQLRVFEKVQGYARSWRNMTKKQRKDAMTSGAPESPIIHEGIAARASFDARLVDAIANAGREGRPEMEPHPNSKPARVVKNLLEIYRSHPEANQVVFMEQGMARSVTRREGPPGNKRNVSYPAFSTVHDMIERLVQAGVPREQIALVDGSTSKDRRKEVADAMNSGKIRIVFGSTDSLGVGVNMQRNLRAMHHMDAPWMPGELEQRNGRGHRQGNQWNTVMEFRYLTDRLDGRRWQVLAIKQKFITDFMKSKGDVRVIEGDAADDSGGDILATFSEAAGDPRLLLREKYKKKLEHLQSRERIHGNAVADAKRAVRDETANMEDAERRLDALRQAGARDAIDALVKSTMGDGFNAVIGGEAFDERAPALIALRKWIVENVRKESPEQKVGTFGGHDVFVHWLYKWADEPSLVLKFPGDVQVTASPSWQSLETQLRNKRDTVEATWEEAIKEAREKIAHARKVTQEPFHLKAQLDDATKRLADLEEDIARNPVAPPYWLRSGAPADTDVVFNDKTFTVTGHRWSDAGWFVVARDERGEIVIPYMEARDTQGMPLYEEREFEKPTVQQGTAAQGVPAKAAPKAGADGDVNLSLGEQAPNLRVDATDLAPETAQAYATTSDADQRAVRRLQTSMARYIPGLRLDAVAAAGGREAGQPLQGADRARVAAAELLRALTGRRAVFFRSSGGPVVNGVHSSLAPDVLFLRHDATRPHMAVLGHEFLHGLRQDRPDLYDVLRERMRLVSTRKHEPGADLQEKRRKLGLAPLSADALEEEFLADVMGDSWMDASFWKSLAGKEPNTLLRRAFTAAMRFVDDVLRKIADLNPFGTNAYLSDIKAARAAMAQALRDYVEVESVGAPAVDLNFSLGAGGQAQTDTPEFRRWFGDSKVVDAQGRPLVVYHGTPAGDIDVFKVSKSGSFGGGIYTTPDAWAASIYANEPVPTGRQAAPTVYPVYVSIKNPAPVSEAVNVGNWRGEQAVRDTLMDRGYDGVIDWRSGEIVAFRPEQIKSATGNSGAFDPGNPDIRFSLGGAVDTLQSNDTARRLSERVIDVLRSDATIGLLGRSVGTPYHLAHAKRADGSLRNPDLRKVYDEAQDYLNDINTFANDPAELAPGVVPMLNKWSDARRPLRLAGEKRAKLARALFEGTLGWTRDDQGNAVQTEDPHKGIVWTGTELRQRFGFDDADVKLYEQTRAAIGRSLDLMAGAEVARQMGGRDLPEGLRAMVSRGDTGRFKGLVLGFLTQQVDAAESALRTLKAEHREQLARFAEATPGPDTDAMRTALKARQAAAIEQAEAKLGKWKSLQAGVQKTYERVEDLKDRGYMPLMRFGPHTVTVRDIDTKEVVFFGMYETQAEANVEARKLRESAEPNEAVSRGEMSQEQWRLFKGMSPETVELFGQVAGIERTPVFEEYIRRTKANHSALKRLIQRKGTPGFSEDVQRVLAAFLTSNARAAAANLHAGAMEEATLDIDQERGLVKDYATKLTQYVQNPTDEAQWLRGLMFTQFIGGSVASAMVNMTQPFTMTLPWLSQHSGPVGAARLLTAGMRSALTRIAPDSDLGKAMARAEKDGIVSPQALHELQGQAVNRFGRTESALRAMGVSTKAAEVIDASLRRALFAWGGFFSLAEQFNRRATFIAAYQLAQEKGMADAFAFAEEAVTETQGQYSRANRPQWARGPVMSTVFTFKQFSIAYIEFLARLPRRERAIAMAVLLVAAGLEGLPFADDLDDLIDTIAQRLFGKAFSAKRAKVELLSEVLGRDGAEWVLRGASALPGFPVDLAGRMSLGNMIPGTGLLRTDGSRDKSSEVLEALGPAGGVLRDAIGEGSLVERFAPVAMRNAAKAVEMNRTGEYRDKLGRKVADVDTADAAAKGLGFQPREIARESRDSRMAQSVVAQTRAAESEIVRLWAQGIVDGEPDKVTQAQEKLAAWNERNPDARIAINRVQIARMARDMRATREDRVIRAAPKELRGRVAEELR